MKQRTSAITLLISLVIACSAVHAADARSDVFQVGPLLSPGADRLLFAQAHGDRSGELFTFDLKPAGDSPAWPPHCAGVAGSLSFSRSSMSSTKYGAPTSVSPSRFLYGADFAWSK